MKRVLTLILTTIVSFLFSKTHAQFPFVTCSPLKFSGVAPYPWAIDGQINDWETILGLNSSDPLFPYGSFIGNNGAYDTYGTNDPDNPDPKSDLRVLSIIHDDYNVYFYLRRLDNNNFPNKAFYFFDINIDGLLNNGEPVVAINFNSQNVNKLSVCRYIPLNAIGDPIGGDNIFSDVCIIDGNSIRGRIEEVFKVQNTPLMPNEIFSAEITENGFGVELAVPWRFISQYKLFAYHLALQKGAGTYSADSPSDNGGGCAPFLDIIGDPAFEVQNSSITTITPGLNYRIDVSYKNLTPAVLLIFPTTLVGIGIGSVSIKDIVQENNLPIDETQFSVTVNNELYQYSEGAFLNQPIVYKGSTSSSFFLEPLATKTISIFISFPSNFSVKSALIEIIPSSEFNFTRTCVGNTGGGGKPINPVGFTLGEEETATTKNNLTDQPVKENTNGQNKKVHVYPNPSNGTTNVILPDDGPFDMVLTDYTGKVINKWSGVAQRILKLENLKPGFYLLYIKSGNNRMSVTKKILIN